MDLGISGRHDHFKILYAVIPHADIGCNGVLKQNDFLIHDGHRACEDTSVDRGDRLSVKQDLSAPGLIKSRDQTAQSRLSAAVMAYYSDSVTLYKRVGKIFK